MNDLALQRLTAAGWTPDRRVDYSSIENAYAKAGMTIPDKLKSFFSSFAFIHIEYDIQHIEQESHYFDPSFDFHNYNKADYMHLFDDYGINGMAYPVGSAYRGNMTIYYHDNGHFYLYMECSSLIQTGDTVESLLNGLIGNDDHDWVNIDD